MRDCDGTNESLEHASRSSSSHLSTIHFGSVDGSNRQKGTLWRNRQALAPKFEKSTLVGCDPRDNWGRFFPWRLRVSSLWITDPELLDPSPRCAQYGDLYSRNGEPGRERGVQWKRLSSGSLASHERHTRTERYHPRRQ